MKYIFFLLTALFVLTSCDDPTTTMPMSQVPTGILVLAFIGMVACILLVFLFILFFGGLIEYIKDGSDY